MLQRRKTLPELSYSRYGSLFNDQQDSFGMLLSDQSRVHRIKSDALGKSRFNGKNVICDSSQNRLYHPDFMCAALYEHFRALLFKKKFNHKIIKL